MVFGLLFRVLGGGSKRIGFLPVDVMTAEEIMLESETTDHAIETGAEITDHVYNRPTIVRVRGTVAAGRRQLAYTTLNLIHRLAAPTSVVTGLSSFGSMIMVNLTIPRTVTTAAPLEFSAEFKQIRLVSSQFTASSGAQAGASPSPGGGAANTAAPSVNNGPQSVNPASPATSSAASSSAAASGGEGGGGSFLSGFF